MLNKLVAMPTHNETTNKTVTDTKTKLGDTKRLQSGELLESEEDEEDEELLSESESGRWLQDCCLRAFAASRPARAICFFCCIDNSKLRNAVCGREDFAGGMNAWKKHLGAAGF